MNSKTPSITLTIDGTPVTVPQGTTIWEAAREIGVDIPALCHSPRLRPAGVCRLCVVDIGERVMAASCIRPCEEGMEVKAFTPRVEAHRKRLTALLLSDYPPHSAGRVETREMSSGDDQLLALAKQYRLETLPYPPSAERAPRRDDSSPVITVDHHACILCDRCIRACDEVQCNHVIGRSGKGFLARIVFDLDAPMGKSSCVACGECMAVCPTNALTNRMEAINPSPSDEGGK